MGGQEAVHKRGAGNIAMVAMVFALLVVMLAAAAPAMASSVKVLGGDTHLTIPKAQVSALTAKNVAILPVSPVAFQFQWSSGISWWFDLPMASGGTFDYTAKKGTLYHDGKLRFVEVLTNKNVLMGGLRVIFTDSHSIALSSAVGTAPATRAVVFQATNTPKYTRQGKTIKVDGIQFKLTEAGAFALKTALGVDLPTTTLFADTDLQFKTK
jgi:hypothetical protein